MTPSPLPAPGDVSVHIGELALVGLPAAVLAGGIGPAVAAELTRLLHERGVPASWSAGEPVGAIRPATITVDRTMRPGQLARRVAAAIYEGLGG